MNKPELNQRWLVQRNDESRYQNVNQRVQECVFGIEIGVAINIRGDRNETGRVAEKVMNHCYNCIALDLNVMKPIELHDRIHCQNYPNRDGD